MPTTITNLRSMQSLGIWADRDLRSPDLQFRKYNLIYGFNGSGKSTLSRVFSSLEAGDLHSRLPGGCEFTISMDDNATFGCPSRPAGLEGRIVVFNADYVEKNLQWAAGLANPVFFIGADQAEAVAEYNKTEEKVRDLSQKLTRAEADERAAEKVFSNYKRDRAKITASQLYLGNRKYEAPALAKDYDSWSNETTFLLSKDAFEAAREIRLQAEPLPDISLLEFDAESISSAFTFVIDACTQSLSTVTLEEIKKFPEMLLWIKDGYKFHQHNKNVSCLLCGNPISDGRLALLSAALDDKIDQFINKLSRTSERLDQMTSKLAELEETLPGRDAIEVEFRGTYKAEREAVIAATRATRVQIAELARVLAEKQKHPAAPADVSSLPQTSEIDVLQKSLASALAALNMTISKHNKSVENFVQRKQKAETDLRKHYVFECKSDYAKLLREMEKAKSAAEHTRVSLSTAKSDAEVLLRLIRTHGPAASAINRLIASYLGHGELTIHPVEQGYELHRHNKAIQGLPSEGEKTAIAIAYFLSSIEADGRKLKDTIVIVDDPVSSLDTKALNFACALVKNRLEGAAQLFILTHNLHCMNEFKKGWKNRARKAEENNGKAPTAAFYFIDVKLGKDVDRRYASLVTMSKLLREYDSEYHYLFSHLIKFQMSEDHYDYSYMMPNVLRRILDVFLAFKCPGSSGLTGQIASLCADYPDLDKGRLVALERLVQTESHSDNLDDLLSFSNMTVEETRTAADTLLSTMEIVDKQHLKGLRRLCA